MGRHGGRPSQERACYECSWGGRTFRCGLRCELSRTLRRVVFSAPLGLLLSFRPYKKLGRYPEISADFIENELETEA